MTKIEFIRQAVISMAGKVIGNDGTTDNGDWEKVIGEAEDLADRMCEHGYLE